MWSAQWSMGVEKKHILIGAGCFTAKTAITIIFGVFSPFYMFKTAFLRHESGYCTFLTIFKPCQLYANMPFFCHFLPFFKWSLWPQKCWLNVFFCHVCSPRSSNSCTHTSKTFWRCRELLELVVKRIFRMLEGQILFGHLLLHWRSSIKGQTIPRGK